jgi:hypothetical protein
MARLRSSSGLTAGWYLIKRPDREPTRFDDTECVYVLRWKTGLSVSARSMTCQHRSAKDSSDDACNADLDIFEDHAIDCLKGP